MKISKLTIAALFAAGFITTSATAGFAEDKPAISGDCVEGYSAVYNEDGFVSCELDVPVDITDVKPIDSCWETEDGVNVCARGGMVPMPLTVDEPTVDSPDCTVTTDEDGKEMSACFRAYTTTGADGEDMELMDGAVDETMIRDLDIEPISEEVDETLMYQSGVAMPASGSDTSSSNMLAAFGVLVAALGALGIGISRQKEAK